MQHFTVQLLQLVTSDTYVLNDYLTGSCRGKLANSVPFIVYAARRQLTDSSPMGWHCRQHSDSRIRDYCWILCIVEVASQTQTVGRGERW